MGKKFVLEFDMSGPAFDGGEGGGEEIERIISDINDAISGAHENDLLGPWPVSDSKGNTIGHFEIVETDESEGSNG